MDSGNSGSLQSSSGDEEYDSRAADSIFMTTHPPPISNAPPQPLPPPPPLLDPLSKYLQLQNENPFFLNPNISWPGPASTRTDPNPTISHGAINPMTSFQPPPAATVGGDNHHLCGAPAAHSPNPTAARNPKKRSRASRRAPTTVLTTDTTNFRAMVQEFTGIPAPPFNNSSFSRSRLDLFTARSTAAQPPPPPYLRRPFPQRLQSPPSFLASSTPLSSSLLTSTSIDASSAANNHISSLCSTPIPQGSNLFNVQNPILTSLLQSNPKFLFSNSSVVGSKSDHNQGFVIPSNDIKIGGLDEFGISDGNHVSASLSGLPNLISPDQIGGQNDGNDKNDEDEEYQARMKRINVGFGFTPNGKMNFSASTSSFHGEKGPENINATRGEGMVESWICSSE